jgi:hypothetical protein
MEWVGSAANSEYASLMIADTQYITNEVYLHRSYIDGNKYNLMVKISITTVLCGYETWSLTLQKATECRSLKTGC